MWYPRVVYRQRWSSCRCCCGRHPAATGAAPKLCRFTQLLLLFCPLCCISSTPTTTLTSFTTTTLPSSPFSTRKEALHIHFEHRRWPALAISAGGILPPQRGIPMIFNRIFRPSRYQLCNIRPFITQFLMCVDQQLLFCLVPGVSLDIRSQLVVPPLSTLLADPPREISRYEAPVSFAMLMNKPT